MNRLLIAAAAALLVGGAATAQSTASLESSFASGRQLLASAIAAHGGEAKVNSLTAARLHLAGDISTGLQGERPETISSAVKEGDFETRVLIDVARQRYRTTGEQRSNGGFVFPFNGLWNDGALKFTNAFPPTFTKQPVTEAEEGREQSAGIGTRMLPPLLLKLASQRLATVRDEGSSTLDGRPVRRLAFNTDKNTRVTLLLDAASHRILGLEQLAADPLAGVTTTRWRYIGERHVDGFALPQSASVQRRGLEFITVRVLDAKLNDAAKLVDDDFALDSRFVERTVPPLAIEQLRPGLWEVSNAGGGFYRVQFAELPDRVVAYDAPVSAAASQAVIAKLREKVPTKPISHVVLSHFHNDHAGGVRAFAATGATLVTTSDARPVIERFARAPAPLVGAIDAEPPALKFQLIDGEADLGTAERPLKVTVARGSPHVNQMLVLLDVTNRVAMAADMYSDVQPFNATFAWFADWLTKRSDVELVAGAHHPATPVTRVMQQRAQWGAQPAKQAARPGSG